MLIWCLQAQWAPCKPWRLWGRWEPLPTPTRGSLLRPGVLAWKDPAAAPASRDPRAAALRGGGAPRGEAGPPTGSYSFLIHSKITHCKFPDCCERSRRGAEERRCCSRGGPGGRGAHGWPGPRRAGRSGSGGLTRKRQNLDTREAPSAAPAASRGSRP